MQDKSLLAGTVKMSHFIQDFWIFHGQVGTTAPPFPISANADDKFPDKRNRNMEQIPPGRSPRVLILQGDMAEPPGEPGIVIPRICYSQGSFLPHSPLL